MRYSDNWAQDIKLHLFSNYVLAVVPFHRHQPPPPHPSLPRPLPSDSGSFSIFPAFCAPLPPLINSPSSHFLAIHSSLQRHSERLRRGFCELVVQIVQQDAASFCLSAPPWNPSQMSLVDTFQPTFSFPHFVRHAPSASAATHVCTCPRRVPAVTY